MPAVPAQFITTSFDLSLFAACFNGFGTLFNNIPNLIMMLFSLVFVTFFDTTGTLMALGRQCGFIDEEGQAVGIENAFLADAVGGIVGAIFGTSTVTAYVESAAGIGIGGKSGLTAIVTGILFILSIFFAPLVLGLFTSPVTCAALVIVGILMIGQLKEVEDKISYARQFYNDDVNQYKNKLEMFPSSLVASFGHFERLPYFEAEASAKEAPHVEF